MQDLKRFIKVVFLVVVILALAFASLGAGVVAASTFDGTTQKTAMTEPPTPNTDGATDVITNPDVIDLFKNGSEFALVIYVVLAVLLMIVTLFGGITMYAMWNTAKISKSFSEALKDLREFAEKFAEYKQAMEASQTLFQTTIDRVLTQMSGDFKAIFDRLAEHEKSLSGSQAEMIKLVGDLQTTLLKAISDMDNDINSMYTYCVASDQLKKRRTDCTAK